MAANRPEAVLDFELHSTRPIQELNTITTIITSSTISTITTSTSPLQKTTTTALASKNSSFSGQQNGNDQTGLRADEEGAEVTKLDAKKQKSTCTCTNIGIMQLFYEMKQKFPTVSDNVVNECVLDHCHNRDACIEKLKAIVAGNNHSGVIQAYPVKSLRQASSNDEGSLRRGSGNSGNTVDKINNSSDTLRKNIQPRITDQDLRGFKFVSNKPQSEATTYNNSSSYLSNQNNRDKKPVTMLRGGGNQYRDEVQAEKEDEEEQKAERPTTLNLNKSPAVINRPFRSAPPIPSVTSSTSSLSSLSVISNLNDPDLLTPSSSIQSGSNESINVSVNVTLSPVLNQRTKPPARPPRHTTAMTVQPEIRPPFASPFANANSPGIGGSSPRSFTSVNFTLRPPNPTTSPSTSSAGLDHQPSSTPADITQTAAGSSVTYSTSSFDPRHGYQSVMITVGNGGGSISAIRTRSPSFQQQSPAVPKVPTVVTSMVSNSGQSSNDGE